MTIVSLTKENLADCIKVFLKAYNGAPWNYLWTAEKASLYLTEYITSSNFIGFILYDDNVAVGAMLGHFKTWWTNDQLMIDEFFIASEKQRKGYGKRLMQFCSDKAKERGAELIVLMTNKYMPAYQFYNKINYTTTEQYVFMFKQL
ncbi:GNAT family N-acetyltransferase [Mucilaginibacter sabulilitoris]|uniref:GNAT family N-acetyltransferase n=1 Tax=Mucilaginibacter sabulilitoris TaxID=1173583 RepID=A0ABZ0TRD8_9SPHI|nr:GNAT family N-acetyltransferase [Mucilaginibacter sabulilitoris]WPU95687.1 GNAT family N-acetyltransferase [Mucilaginibacter sabulilitoris]